MIRTAAIAMALALLLAAAAVAQVRPIEQMPITLSGVADFGYAGGTGNGSLNDTFYVGTNATLDGYYHDPRFLRFNIAPNYRWTRNGTEDLNARDTNQGVSSQWELFSGSSMPISFHQSFLRVYTATLAGGGVPLTVASTGASNDFDVNWSFHRGRLPSLSASYAWGSGNNSIEGLQGPEMSNSHSGLTLLANYTILKFRLTAGYTLFNMKQQRPDVFNVGVSGSGQTDQSTENFSLSRSLPLRSTLDARFSRNHTNTDYIGTPLDQQFDVGNLSLNSTPTRRLTLNFGSNYSSNAAAQAISQLVTPGGTALNLATGAIQAGSGRSVSTYGGASFAAGHGLWFTGSGDHESASFGPGQKTDANGFSGGVMYSRVLKRGIFSANYTAGLNNLDFQLPTLQVTTNSLAQSMMAGYIRQLGRWTSEVSFRYSGTGVDTAVTPVPLVARNYAADFNTKTRLWHRWNFNAGFNLNHNDNTSMSSSSSFSKGFNLGLSNRNWNFMVQDQFNSGAALVTAYGILPVNLPPALPTLLTQTYNTSSSGLTFAATYSRRRLTLIGIYSTSHFDLAAPTGPTMAGNSNLDMKLYYKLRKIELRAGYHRWTQDTTTLFNLNRTTQAWYVEIARAYRIF